MGCFSTCFRKSKRRRSRRPTKPNPCFNQLLQIEQSVGAVQPTSIKEQETSEILINPSPDSINVSERKKVTFDLNVRVYEELPARDENNGNFLVERSSEEDTEKCEKEEIKVIKEKESNRASDSSSSSSLISFPSKAYRYQDCRDSDDEFEEFVSEDEGDHDYMGDDEDEDEETETEVNNDPIVVHEEPESSEDAKTIELNEDGFDSVLHPVENLTQWKAIKARSKLEPRNDSKENMISGQECDIPIMEEPVLKPAKSMNTSCQEIAVDTSLSSWLTPTKSKTSSVSVGNSLFSERTCSPKDFEDRPILGALTVEEIKQFSATSTPRRSPSRSPDDMPIIGSVGSYWSPTDQSSGTRSRSKYNEVRKVNSNSSRIPFEKRLERAALQKTTVIRP